MHIEFEHIPPPDRVKASEAYYDSGWAFADNALRHHGPDACAKLRKDMRLDTSYEHGAADRFDGKAHKYGKDVSPKVKHNTFTNCQAESNGKEA